MSGRIIASQILKRYELKVEPTSLEPLKDKAIYSDELISRLKTKEYRLLFDSVIGIVGGWTSLLGTLTPESFDREIQERIRISETVYKMIDYRFRYLDQGGRDSTQANISHSEFYRWKDKPGISWRTLRERWRLQKESAAFLYASNKLSFAPNSLNATGFLPALVKSASDTAHIRKFFGTAAYVLGKLEANNESEIKGEEEGEEEAETEIQIPRGVKRLRPHTTPLTEDEQERMSHYANEKDLMRGR